MKKYIEESLAADIIHPSSSPAGPGFFFVEKKDGTLRLCIDYRGQKPLPSSAFELQGVSVFYNLDCRSAYHLVHIKGEESKMAVNTSSGHYEYLVMPITEMPHSLSVPN